jgi:polyhydroxyalkanoate synthesis regulator phasin
MYSLNNLIDYLTLPNHYLNVIYEHLEKLAKEAIDDGDLHTANRILLLIMAIQEIKKEAEPVQIEKEKKLEEPVSKIIPRYTGYDEETKEMRDAIIRLVQNNLLSTKVDISSRTLYSIIQRHHLSNIEPSKLDLLTLPMSEARQDRPRWKEAVTQALIMMIGEGYLEKTSRYGYSWTEKAQTELHNQPTENSEVETVEDKVDMNITKEEYIATAPISEVNLPQPFAAFSKPKIYGQNGTQSYLSSRSI